MAEKTSILFWLIVYLISSFILVTVELCHKLHTAVFRQREEETDLDTASEYMEFCAT